MLNSLKMCCVPEEWRQRGQTFGESLDLLLNPSGQAVLSQQVEILRLVFLGNSSRCPSRFEVDDLESIPVLQGHFQISSNTLHG